MLSSTSTIDWDDPLPDALKQKWESWLLSLKELEYFRIARQYTGPSFVGSTRHEVHIFSDASKEAIAPVAYLKLYHGDSVNISFLFGKAKVAPAHGHTIPRLELCAAALADEISDTIRDQLEIDPDNFIYYTDSRVILGYLTNETRRFKIYVGNRVSVFVHLVHLLSGTTYRQTIILLIWLPGLSLCPTSQRAFGLKAPTLCTQTLLWHNTIICS